MSLNINTPLDIDVRANDIDPSFDSLGLPSIITLPLHGTVSGTPIITYAPDLNFLGADSFMYQVCDTNSPYSPAPLCDTGWAIMNVHPVNAGPDITTCDGQTVSMAASQQGYWTVSPSNPAVPIVNNSTSPTTTVSGLVVPGIYRLAWNMAAGSDTVNIIVLGRPIANAGPDQTICQGDTAIVGASPTASGGSGSYSYAWFPASLVSHSAAPNPLVANDFSSYSVIVTDIVSGCTAYDTVSVSVRYLPSVFPMAITSLRCSNDSNGSIYLASPGGAGPYTYTWLPATSASDSITGLGPGHYCVTVTDPAGCHSSNCFDLSAPPPLVVTDSIVNESYAGANDGAIYISVTGGTPPYTYAWSPPTTQTPNAVALYAGSYSVLVTDASGCSRGDTAIIPPCSHCVWPGDADANLLVDNNDLLPIGLGYDSTGPARAVTSIVWQGNAATDWAQSFGSYTPAVNYKYADCNGDGVIDATDTTAITQNFSLTHNKTILRKPWRSGDPVIYPLLSKDTVANGDTLTVEIHLGDVSLTATNVYGLAYTINYDPAVLDTTKTTFTYGSSWLGSPADMISISKDLPAQGVVKTAVTRIDHTTRSGSGVIAQMRAIVTTDNIDGKDLSYYPVQIIISDVRAIDQHGNVLQVNEGTDSTEVGYTPLGMHSMTADADIAIYPNPANSLLHITSAKAVMQSAEVVNTLGEIVGSYTWTGTQTEHTADLSSLASGIYYIRIHTRSGVAVRKFSIAH